MFTIKHVVVFFILQNTVSLFCFNKGYCLDSPDSSESMHTDESSDHDGLKYWDKYSGNNVNENLEHNFYEYPEDSDYNEPEDSDYEDPEDSDYEDFENYIDENSKNNYNENSKNISDENSKNNSDESWEIFLNKICPEEEHSLISRGDIKYLIEDKADTLKIEENLLNRYYPVAKEILKNYMGELEEIHEKMNGHPEHMLHILHDMAGLRLKLEPDVEEAATRLEEFYNSKNNINDVKGSAIMLNQLEKYKTMCKINCEEISIENRFGHKIDYNPFPGMYCVRLKDLNENINNKLRDVQAQYDEGLNQQLEIIYNMYAQKITELKINLKGAAEKQLSLTMFDILILQDDYHHFVKDFKHVNISSEIHNIRENSAEIDFRLIRLHRDLEKYRQYCRKCNMDQRVKRNVLYWRDDKLEGKEESFVIPIEKITDAETNYLDELIKARIYEIRESIESNFTSMFEELDEKFNDFDVIDDYVSQIYTIQDEIGNYIKTEQEALRRLRSRIPEASINKMLALSKESKQIIQNLESAKQFIDQFISRNSM